MSPGIHFRGILSGLEKGVVTKGVFSLAESLESLKSLDSLKKSLENGRVLLRFPESGGSPETLESLNSLKSLENFDFSEKTRRRTNVQQLTCNIDLSRSFYYLFFSFVLFELKPFVLKGKVLGKNSEKV